MPSILVTGGAGYIGSHTVMQLLEAGHEVVIVDNLSNSLRAAIQVIEHLTGKNVPFYDLNLNEEAALSQVFDSHRFDAVIHFAALKAVAESVSNPLTYYINNVRGTMSLISAMKASGVRRLVYSSSATVYGNQTEMPLREEMPVNSAAVANPYGRTKVICEEMLSDLCASDPRWSVTSLRYFNPIGAHPSGDLGESPLGRPNNVMPNITEVAKGESEAFLLYGDDYPTPDGTCIRDYVHIQDLASGHLAALDYLEEQTGFAAFNLGNGIGYSVLQLLAAFEEATGIAIPYRIEPRRPGDVPVSYADPTKAREILGWQAKLDLVTMCRDAWRWQEKHPNGF